MFSVIIPNYNGKELLEECLISVSKALKDFKKSEIIVVDNNSSDGSVKWLKKLQPHADIHVIFNSQNLGFPKACNQGAKIAKNKYLVIMNNDIKLNKNWFKIIKKNINKYKKNKIGCYFGKVLNKNGTKIESIGINFELCGKSSNLGNNEPDITKYDETSFIWGAPAPIVVYFKSAYNEVGGFDPDFFAYIEDVDLAIRLNQHHWKTLYLPKAISYHIGGATSNQMGKSFRYQYTARNWWYFFIKHYSGQTFIKNLLPIIIEQTKNLLISKNIFWVIKEIILNFGKMYKKRDPERLL